MLCFLKKTLLFLFFLVENPQTTGEVESSPQQPPLSKLGKAGGKQTA